MTLLPVPSDQKLASEIIKADPNSLESWVSAITGRLDDTPLLQLIAQYRIDCMREVLLLLQEQRPSDLNIDLFLEQVTHVKDEPEVAPDSGES